MSDIIGKSDTGLLAGMEIFDANIGHYLPVLGLLANDPIITQFHLDTVYLRALLKVQGIVQKFGTGWTTWKNYERDGGAVAVPTPEMPVLDTDFPAAVPPGIVPRVRFAYNYVKARPNYTPAIGRILGIEAAQQTGPDSATLIPAFTLDTSVGKGVMVNWTWQGHSQFLDRCEIRVDRADGKGEILLCQDTTPGYLDTQPFPAAPAKWTYRIRFIVGDEYFGQWSNPVSITVGG